MPWLAEVGWEILDPIKPGFRPLTKLETVLISYLSVDEEFVYECINEDPEGLKTLLKHFPHKQHLLLVDQFEELFTVTEPQQRDRFIELITQVATIPDSPLAVVTTMRADFLEPCLLYDSLRQLIQNNAEYLANFKELDLIDAIVKPAERQGYEVTKDLLNEILEDVKPEPGFLPLLEFALTQLWERRDEAKHQLTFEAYQAIGWMEGALNCHADKVYQYRDYEEEKPVKERTEAEKALIKRIFLNLLQIGDGEKDIRLRQSRSKILSLAGDNQEGQKILRKLIEVEGKQGLVTGRLLVTGGSEGEGDAWVDLAHEALIQKWDKLNLWRTETRKGRELTKQVDKDAQTWENRDKSLYYLWSGDKLADAEKVLQEYKATVETTNLAKKFLQASSQQELRSYLRSPKIDDLDQKALEKEVADKFFLTKDKLWDLLENETEEPQIRLAASWLLKQWGEEVPIWTAEVDGEGKIALSIIAENHLPTTVIEELEGGISLEMVEIPDGEFWMGATATEEKEGPKREWEYPQHEVKVSPFLIGRYPVTQAQWRAVASLAKVERDLNPEGNPEGSSFEWDSRRPVETVTWYEAVEFCKRLSCFSKEKGKGYHYRLPSEAEWEYACRAIKNEKLKIKNEESIQNPKSKIQNPSYPPFHFGQKIDPALANYRKTARGKPTPVGRFQVANRFGLYDLHGNVWEWCEDDWHYSYDDAPDDGSAWLSDSDNNNNSRLIRGGSFLDRTEDCRSAIRRYSGHDDRGINIGLRVVASPRT
jgi:formylglycine-generating enzyme required for sulfatase activity